MAVCARCNSELLAGARWCGICHTNTVDPDYGRLASPGQRLGAFVLDVSIPIVALFLAVGVGGAVGSAGGDEGILAGAVGLPLLLFLAYAAWALVLFARGTTPGKRILNMHVIKESGQRATFGTMFFREWIGKWLSGVVFGIGYLWVLFDDNRQGWHDKLASTFVVRPS